MEADDIVSVNIDPETVLGIRMERAVGTEFVVAGASEPAAEMGFGVFEH